jgi:hypothetical protein
MFKYNIKSRGREGDQNTWQIEDLDSGEMVYTDHIELKVPVSTIEKSIEGKGFGMVAEGVIEWKEHPSVGKFAIIKKEE